MNIILLGPHGAGKTTQARLISDFLHIPRISTGEIFHTLYNQDSLLGRHFHSIMDKGDYVPDSEVIPMVEERLAQGDARAGFILEGYPRTLQQAQSLVEKIDVVFHLRLSDNESVRRQLARHRHDDTPELIRHRLDQHYAEADQVLAFYKNRNLLQEVDAHRSIAEIDSELLARIEA